MKYKSFVFYVQNEMNYFLREFKSFAKCYVDDIIIFFKNLQNYLYYFYLIL